VTLEALFVLQADMANLLGVRMEKSLEDLKKSEATVNKLTSEDR